MSRRHLPEPSCSHLRCIGSSCYRHLALAASRIGSRPCVPIMPGRDATGWPCGLPNRSRRPRARGRRAAAVAGLPAGRHRHRLRPRVLRGGRRRRSRCLRPGPAGHGSLHPAGRQVRSLYPGSAGTRHRDVSGPGEAAPLSSGHPHKRAFLVARKDKRYAPLGLSLRPGNLHSDGTTARARKR